MTLYICSGIIALLIVTIITLLLKLQKANTNAATLTKLLSEIQTRNQQLDQEIKQYIQLSAANSAKIESSQLHINKLEQQLTELDKLYNTTINERFNAEKQMELYAQKLIDMQTRMEDWEQTRHETMQNAKAAIFELGNQLSNKLLEDHKRENLEAKKDSQDKLTETTTKLNEQFQTVTNVLATLNSQVQESKNTIDIVKRSLLSPSGAGSLAEITLENILKASGLIEGQDFIMQYTISNDSGNKLRPDVIIFLPAGNIMVIDSKASKFFLELGMNQANEEILNEKLKTSMRTHLRSLMAKDYMEAVRSQLLKSFHIDKINHIITVMFLPSEIALDKLQNLDIEFMRKAWEAEIYPAGPVGVINMLAYAKFQINEQKQINNYKNIMEEVRKLLLSFASLHEHLRKLGGNIHSAIGNYDKMASSFNNNLLPKIRNLNKLGITPQKSCTQLLNRYQLVASTEHRSDEVLAEAVETEQ